MTAGRFLVCGVVVLGSITGLVIAQAPGPPTPPTGQGATPPAGGRAGGGGRGGPGATLYTDNCSGCHGADLSGGRAPTLFDAKWLATTSDEKILAAIKNGVRGTEMEGFGQQLNDQQMWQLVQYIRTQSGNLKPPVPFVADPDGREIKTEKQTFKIEVVARGLET